MVWTSREKNWRYKAPLTAVKQKNLCSPAQTLNTQLCVSVWLVSGESCTLTQGLSSPFDTLVGFQWNTNMEVRMCVLRRLGMTKQSKKPAEANKAPQQQMCVCLQRGYTHVRQTRHTLQGITVDQVVWVTGTDVSKETGLL